MSHGNPALIGSVFERTPGLHTAPRTSSSGKTGFPAVQHRSKSAFARGRDESRKFASSRSQDVPVVVRSEEESHNPVEPADWRNQISRENEQRVADMTEEEREEERREIMNKFGAGVGDLLKRSREARERQAEKDRIDNAQAPIKAIHPSSSQATNRKIRFSDPAPKDVYAYTPDSLSSPIQSAMLPSSSISSTATSPGEGSTKSQLGPDKESEPEEGTAEYIRRRFFPDAPSEDPRLAWMDMESPSSTPAPSSLRFDLTGTPISASLSSSLPTHLGLHHHAEGAHAGYTLDDVFLLSRSSVPAQRATMLNVLAKIARRLSRMKRGDVDVIHDLKGQEEELRGRIIAAGIEAMAERGSLGARAIDVIWECVVGWDERLINVEGVELQKSSDSTINSLPLDRFLESTATALSQGDVTIGSLTQVLSTLHRLAQQSNHIASAIVATPKLINNVVQTFLLTSIPPRESTPLPNPFALEFLVTLVLSSRLNAQALKEPADSLLRFITISPATSPYPLPLTTSILISTIHFYTALASYGYYSHIATTAMMHFSQLGQYIVSDACTSKGLMVAWIRLLEMWTVCAVDPHKTTPSHDILWSQIVSWGWNEELVLIESKLKADKEDWDVWAAVWGAQATWLEGSRINGVRGGKTERLDVIETVKGGFEDGREKNIVSGIVDTLRRELEELHSLSLDESCIEHLRAMGGHANVLAAAIRLWLACLPPLSDGPLLSPPFPLPFSQISELCARLVAHPLWRVFESDDTSYIYAFCRPLSALLSFYLRLGKRHPGVSEDLWMAQALIVLARLLPGDEDSSLQILEEFSGILTPEWVSSRIKNSPSIIWERGGISTIQPFLMYTLLPQQDIRVGPSYPSSHSIKISTTQRLPSTSSLHEYGLPVKKDWMLSPLEHLLRSGSSAVMKMLPTSWDASETEIARTSLFLTKITQELLTRFSLVDIILNREEVVFGCMKIFMLEHGQPQNDSAEEVFRDHVVGQLMDELLEPYTIAAASASVAAAATQTDLEKVSARFLGSSTPFYQYYTDFLALYDAVSFSHPLFGRLLLPPTSMRYAPDYRKILWNDYGHVLRTIHTPVDQVISGDVREYLWPIEEDAQMIGLYLRSIVNGSLQGFVRLVALHHVACNVWPDLRDKTEWKEDRASKLLRAVVVQGSIDTVRDVVLYHQSTTGPVRLGPSSLKDASEVRTLREGYLHRLGGSAFMERLQALLNE